MTEDRSQDVPDLEEDGDPEEQMEALESRLPELAKRVETAAGKQSEPWLAQLLLLLPRLVAFFGRVVRAPEVAAGWKARVVLVVAYVFSPIDLIPDFIPGLGLVDDLYLVLLTIDQLLNHVPREAFDRCWTWDREVIDGVRSFADKVSGVLPHPARRVLDGFFGDSAAS